MAGQLLRDLLAAAVVAGSALEAQLRARADGWSVSTHARGKAKRTKTLNEELTKHGVYSMAEQKQLTA